MRIFAPNKWVLSVVCLYWFSGTAQARFPGFGDRALPCRPTVACTADIVPAQTVEIELGYQGRFIADQGTRHSAPFLLKYTVWPWLQAQVASNGPALQRQPVLQEYFDDVQVGPKFHLWDQTPTRPSVALSVAISLPTMAAPGYVRTYDLLTAAFITKDVGPVHLDLNVGFNLWRLRSPLQQYWGALAATAQLTPVWAVMAEVYGFSSASPISTADAGLLLAVSVAPMPWLVCDIGGIVSADRATSLGTAFIGLTVIPVTWANTPGA